MSWATVLEVKWPVKLYFQLKTLHEKRKCEPLNKSFLFSNSSHPSFLAERLFNCPHLDALTLVLLTAINYECPHTTVKEGQRIQAHKPVVAVWNTRIRRAITNTVDSVHKPSVNSTERHTKLSCSNIICGQFPVFHLLSPHCAKIRKRQQHLQRAALWIDLILVEQILGNSLREISASEWIQQQHNFSRTMPSLLRTANIFKDHTGNNVGKINLYISSCVNQVK